MVKVISKIGFWFKLKAGLRSNPPRQVAGSSTRILKYVEDLERCPNTEIGPKDFFEMALRSFSLPQALSKTRLAALIK